ncbi:MAG TPA: tRNA (adenosine(37)-N6)-threonylcarbamoyltransferase complex transferase subunit TsaD [Candidatus Limnocylindrales bacterium]|nr:tRNA (adenosine(37)-N6)-threonylcarbamoyltransferase complex transferase subunit TsaD [Candidatus Limnocylindrales bacterium]
MIILGIETSCDETSAAIVEKKGNIITLHSNVISSSLEIHAKTGGIIPENAAREQIKYILPVIHESLSKAKIDLKEIDAIAVTYGPGLIGSLLVGIETVKTIAFVKNIPLIPINHMVGHIYANWIDNHEISFPVIGLVVSGGHTDLLLIENHGKIKLLGGTRDDAAGEAFDKIARLLGLKPVGPEIEKAAQAGNPKRFRFPRPLIGSGDFDFSFSGLKTAVLRETQNVKNLDPQNVADIALATQEAIVDVLVKKTIKAAIEHDANTILISGGVAANQSLRDKFSVLSSQSSIKFFAPAKKLCTDNAAMIANAACFNFEPVSWNEVTADPELYFN